MSLVLGTDVSRGPTQTCIYEQNCTQQIKDQALYIYATGRKARIRELGEDVYTRISSMLQLDCYPSS